MIVLDAGVAIALLDPDDAHHDRAVTLFSEAPGETFAIHRLNLAEALVSPARAGRERQAREALFRLGVAVAELGDEEDLLLARLRALYRLKMPDICALATALHSGAPLETFDKKLGNAWLDALRTPLHPL